jgi:hypothetical protein
MLSLSLALVCNVFPSEEQPRALGIWAAVSAIALAIGPARRRPADRTRLAGDLLDEPAGPRGRGRDHPRRGAGAGTGYGLILVGYLLFGIALGLVYAPMSTAAMARCRGRRSGSPPASWRWTGFWRAPSPDELRHHMHHRRFRF